MDLQVDSTLTAYRSRTAHVPSDCEDECGLHFKFTSRCCSRQCCRMVAVCPLDTKRNDNDAISRNAAMKGLIIK